MRQLCQSSCLRLLSIVSVLFVFTGCAYYAAVNKLSPDEQTEFRIHSKMMSGRQMRTYLAKASAAERSAYLREIGSAQRFEALEAQDRESVLAGYIRKGMSAEALRFLWGEPYSDRGYTGHYEHWYYFGSALDLASRGTSYSEAGTIVDVYLVDNRVKWWLETVPSTLDEEDSEIRRRN